MEIALYQSHHHLPFNDNPQNPIHVFNAGLLDRVFYRRAHLTDSTKLLKEHWIAPILLALHSMNAPKLMAHVSVDYDHTMSLFPVHRAWIRITSAAHERRDYLPMIVDPDGRISVINVWETSGDMHSPYELLGEYTLPEDETVEFWKSFFTYELLEAKKNAQKERKKMDKRFRRASKYADWLVEALQGI